MRATLGKWRTRTTARVLVVLVSGLLIWAAVGISVSAGTTSKTYTAAIAGSAALFAGASGQGVSIVIGNTTSPQSLGSVNILLPTGIVVLDSSGSPADSSQGTCFGLSFNPARTITIESACYLTSSTTIGGVTATGPVIGLRNLNLAPTATVTVSFTVRAECSGAHSPYRWPMEVKQSNDFNGLPGNDFVITDASGGNVGEATNFPTSTISTTCTLAFETQPHDASKGAVITSETYNPAGVRVRVGVHDATSPTAADSLVKWWSGPISLELAVNPGGPEVTLSLSSIPSDGVATFEPTIGTSASGYVLSAQTQLETTDNASAISAAFNIVDAGAICAANSRCNGSSITAKLNAIVDASAADSTDFLSLSIGSATAPTFDCSGYFATTAVVEFNVTGERTKTITATISQGALYQSAQKYQVCYKSPLPFVPRGGGAQVNLGLLPDCNNKNPLSTPPPCTLSRSADKLKNVTIVFLAPAGDPAGKF